MLCLRASGPASMFSPARSTSHEQAHGRREVGMGGGAGEGPVERLDVVEVGKVGEVGPQDRRREVAFEQIPALVLGLLATALWRPARRWGRLPRPASAWERLPRGFNRRSRGGPGGGRQRLRGRLAPRQVERRRGGGARRPPPHRGDPEWVNGP